VFGGVIAVIEVAALANSIAVPLHLEHYSDRPCFLNGLSTGFICVAVCWHISLFPSYPFLSEFPDPENGDALEILSEKRTLFPDVS
jgi:hypothetical protein